MRKKDCNITPFVQLSPRLNDQTSSGNGAKVLQSSWTTVREKDSGQEDDTENTPSEGQWGWVEERQGEGVSEWGKRVHECHQGGEYVEQHLWGLERLHCQGRLSHHPNQWSLLW